MLAHSFDVLTYLKEYTRNGSSLSGKEAHILHSHLHAVMPHMTMLCLTTLARVVLLTLVKSTLAEQQNITIDDAYSGGDNSISLSYFPNNGWAIGNICKGCNAQPNRSQILDETWHDASSMHDGNLQCSIGFHFTGVAVYAYFILANNFTGSFSSLTNLTFVMDGEEDGAFLHLPSPDPTFEYNALVYSKANLKNGPHSLNISTTGNNTSLILFDYFNYTVDIAFDPVPPLSPLPRPTSSSLGTYNKKHAPNPIVDGLVSAIVVVILMAVLVLILLARRGRGLTFLPCLRRRQCRENPHAEDSQLKSTQRSSMETLPDDYHEAGAPPLPNITLAEKHRKLQTNELQQRIEALRAELMRCHYPSDHNLPRQEASSVTSIRPSESASRIYGPDNAVLPQVSRHVDVLRARIRHWEEQLAVESQSSLSRSQG